MKLTFQPMNAVWTGEAGATAMQAAALLGVPLDADCAGNGTCGKCKVRIVFGAAPEPEARERELLSPGELAAGWRLACLLRPGHDLVLEVPQRQDATQRKTALNNAHRWIAPAHGIVKKTVRLAEPGLDDQKSLERLFTEAAGAPCVRMHPAVCREIAAAGMDYASPYTVTVCGDEIIHAEAGDTAAQCYGVAFDIGTTTVVGMLWNLVTGERAAVCARTNPQAAYGADVISRITYAGQSPEQLEAIHRSIIDGLNGLTEQLAGQAGVAVDHIYEIAVVGNTTMAHLLLGANPSALAKAPFTPVLLRGVSERAAEIGLLANPLADYCLLPCIAGHVGADITAGLVAVDLTEQTEATLFIDIGTNGEIVLSAAGRMLACSTAAGPAFEGSSIYQGMRAADGAVEKIRIDEGGVRVKTIGDAPAVGICGSGIIDAAAQLVRAGVADKSGRLLTEEKLLAKGMPQPVVACAREGANGREFVLAAREGAEDIVINQKDLREVQLAKGAIQAGVQIMLEECGLGLDDLGQVLIAGAFGNHIDVESAVAIGLIPDIDRAKIRFVGNAAGLGASQALLSAEKRRQAEEIAGRIAHIELSTRADFQEKYLKAMRF